MGIDGRIRLETRRQPHGDDNRDPLGRWQKTSGSLPGAPATVLRGQPPRRFTGGRRRCRRDALLLQCSNPLVD